MGGRMMASESAEPGGKPRQYEPGQWRVRRNAARRIEPASCGECNATTMIPVHTCKKTTVAT